jgi:hypothetical protein
VALKARQHREVLEARDRLAGGLISPEDARAVAERALAEVFHDAELVEVYGWGIGNAIRRLPEPERTRQVLVGLDEAAHFIDPRPDLRPLAYEVVREQTSRWDLTLSPTSPPTGYQVALRAHVGDATYLTIAARGLLHADLAGPFAFGDMLLVHDLATTARFTPKWRSLHLPAGAALLMLRSAHTADWTSADPDELHLLAATTLDFLEGPAWPEGW